MSNYIYTNDGLVNADDLAHYGVPGMRWGVRRNLHVLSNNRRNNAVRDARIKYKNKQITSKQKREAIKKANLDKKRFVADQKAKYKKAKDKSKYAKSLANQTLKNVPHSKIKKGAHIVNKLITAASAVGTTASGIVALANPITAPLALPVMVSSTAVNIGRHYVTKMILDKLS